MQKRRAAALMRISRFIIAFGAVIAMGSVLGLQLASPVSYSMARADVRRHASEPRFAADVGTILTGTSSRPRGFAKSPKWRHDELRNAFASSSCPWRAFCVKQSGRPRQFRVRAFIHAAISFRLFYLMSSPHGDLDRVASGAIGTRVLFAYGTEGPSAARRPARRSANDGA